MIIGIDGFPLTIPFPCGSKHYAKNLILALSKEDKKNQYFIFASKSIVIPDQNNFHLQLIPNVLPIFKRQLFLNYLVKKENADIFHYLDPFGSIFFNHKNIITTVHDINLDIIYPKNYYWQKYFCQISRNFVFKQSYAFITDTINIKEELSQHLKRINKKAKIYQINLAADREFIRLKTGINMKEKYILCMADYSSRKNIELILTAFSLLPKKIQESVELYIVISTPIPRNSILKRSYDLKIENFIKILEGVSQGNLIKLFNNAVCFLYPSLYEGFGLPILEAMACGCPVITSNRGAMKEVAGDATFLVNPKSVNEITNSIRILIDNVPLAKNLSKLGLKHAKKYTWKKTAQKTLKVYKKVFEEKN